MDTAHLHGMVNLVVGLGLLIAVFLVPPLVSGSALVDDVMMQHPKGFSSEEELSSALVQVSWA